MADKPASGREGCCVIGLDIGLIRLEAYILEISAPLTLAAVATC